MVVNEADRLFEGAISDILEKTWQRYPDLASGLGLHQFDGRIPDISKTSLAERTRELQIGIASLENIDNAALSHKNYYDYQIILTAIRKELFELTELKLQETNPMEMLWHIELSHYVRREYAPLEERVTALVSALRAVPKYLGQLQELLSHHNQGNKQGAINEAIAFMSVSMNFLRWSGLNAHEIADAIKDRIDTRYRGKVRAIINRDAGRYGV